MPTSDLRLDAARERVVRLLTDRYADDTLTAEEFEARLDQLHALADPAALDAMARDLERPGAWTALTVAAYPAPYRAPYRAPPAAYQAPAAPAWTPATPPDEGRIFAFMSGTKRRGAWAVPPSLRATAVLSELVLDLREAMLPAVCEIELFALLANVHVILPPGVDALVELDAAIGAAEDRTRARTPGQAPHGPRVRVTGMAVLGEVKVSGG